jgi:hypothetical protein
MKKSTRLQPLVLLLAILASLVMPLLPPATPALAASSYTWNTQAQFDAGVLNNVDTDFSPNNVVLAINLNTGNGSDGALAIDAPQFIDDVRSALSSTSMAHETFLVVNTTSGFAAGQEILIIQMTGQGAGKWETNTVLGTGSGTLILNTPLNNIYYADANSQAQVLKVPNYTDVTIGPGGELMCHFWNASGNDYTGGVMFFRATGTVTVSSGGSSTVTFNIMRNEPGTYDVYVGESRAGSFTVDQFTPDIILYISGALVLLAFILGAIWMTRKKA